MLSIKPIVGILGHKTLSHPPEAIKRELRMVFQNLNPALVFMGIDFGFDCLVAEVCLEMNIPYIAVLPYENQEKAWPLKQRESYLSFLNKAEEIKILHHGVHTQDKKTERNKWIVNNSDIMVIYYNKVITSGSSRNSKVINIQANI